jgi:hypothetical protein
MVKKPAIKNQGAIKEKTKALMVRSELNLERNSVFAVSTYRKKSREIVIRDTSSPGEVFERRAIIGRTVDGVETGVLTVHHFKVYLALVELWEKAGKPIHGPIHFTTLRIMKRLGMADSGWEYERLKKWLFHLRQIPLTFVDSFFIPKEGSFKSLKPFTILNHLEIYERKKVGKEQKTRGYGEFRFDDHILESLINNYTHPLRFDVIKSFKKRKDLTILLYVYLDRNLALRKKYVVRLEKLFEHLDLSQTYIRRPSDRKVKIEPVLKELEGRPLSTGILSSCRIYKAEDGRDYKLIAHKRPFQRLTEPEEAPAQLPTARSELITLLTEQGLTESQARELVSQRDEKIIKLQLEALPYRLKRYKEQGEEANKAAVLYRSIKEDWSAPKEYWETKEREEREKRAKYYNLYHCRNMDCQYRQTLLKVAKEGPQPRSCPRCGSDLELEVKDWKEY